jgi:hypothetical protein
MTFRNVLKWAGLVALVALVGGIYGQVKAATSPTVYRVGNTVDLKKVALKDLDGKAVNWDTYRNKILVINYFATW